MRSNSGIERQGLSAFRCAAVLAAAVALLAGCSSDPPAKPSALVDPVPKVAPRTVGSPREDDSEERNLVQAFGGTYSDAKVESLLDAVSTRLTAASVEPNFHYRITVLNSSTVNAFSLPDGHLYFTRGLLALASSTSEIAAVVAHEMAHVIAHHAMQRVELEKNSALISRVAAEVLNDHAGSQSLAEKSKISLASFSRQQEFEADAIGIRTMAKAGYDPYGASRFLASLARYAALRQAGSGGSSDKPDMLATHPATADRVKAALQQARQLNAPGVGEDDRARYLAAVDGLAFGEDPSQGVVRGREFIHTRLDIGFTAPDGFVLSASADAVQGAAAATGRAMRFDTVEVPAETSLDQYLKSGWIEGVEVSNVTTLDVGGMSAETGIAKSGDWSFRLAAIRQGGVVYRLIYAARNLSADADRSFMQSIATFHRLSRDETAKAKPLHLRIVTAGPNDTAETLAAPMLALGLPIEEFAMLNGLDKSDTIIAGSQYKVVGD